MQRKLIYSLPCVLLVACADTSDKYRDIQHLELPPTLAIEHTQRAAEESETSEVDKPIAKKKSILDGVEQLTEKDGKPILLINTRLDRAWDLTETAIKLADIEVLDRNRNDLSIQVTYDPDGGGFISLLNNQVADYTLNLKATSDGIEVSAKLAEKTASGDPQTGFDDASGQLIKRLHQVLQDKVLNRDNNDS